MRNVCRGLLLLSLAAVVAFACNGIVPAQGGEAGEGVKITTVDGVELHGLFFQSSKKDAPTVIVLHAIGDSGTKKVYLDLARTLQPNYSVMTFDFRGHGKSKEIDPEKFWAIPTNAKLVKGFKKKTSVELSDFNKAYYPALVNDIAAVKAYLDRKNDTGACNTSSTILIGAETGATLGAIWLNSEWHLYRMIPNPNNPLLPPQLSPTPDGKDIIACIWLSASTKLGSWDVALSKALEIPVRVNACPTVFMYGDKDERGKTLANDLTKRLKVGDDKKYSYIAAYPVAGNTKLVGGNLLQKSLGTDKAIADYLEAVVEKKGNEWGKLDFATSQYVWKGTFGTTWAKQIPGQDSKNLNFSMYEQFLGR